MVAVVVAVAAVVVVAAAVVVAVVVVAAVVEIRSATMGAVEEDQRRLAQSKVSLGPMVRPRPVERAEGGRFWSRKAPWQDGKLVVVPELRYMAQG